MSSSPPPPKPPKPERKYKLPLEARKKLAEQQRKWRRVRKGLPPDPVPGCFGSVPQRTEVTERTEQNLKAIMDRVQAGEKFDDIFVEIVVQGELNDAQNRPRSILVVRTDAKTGEKMVFHNIMSAARATLGYCRSVPTTCTYIRAAKPGEEVLGYFWELHKNTPNKP